MAVTEPKYSVESKSNHIEIRLYESTTVAETVVEADFDEAGNKAFRILADYILAITNRRRKSI